ncbi:hypothetical protein Poli38472_011379 [Pythium oligandrum]|uniref:Uncharacterized protein n=1 Tax=Pythium oligandrum TaxID=41045 RepID=A0A8K1FKS5_PYTOL|nr:hypothetical protein Poli38472_011379 [Pythium oligandrum]|eukprot:TMW64499.1 hypothetical protein Poli38472_011379 [Pythium oligandrum]
MVEQVAASTEAQVIPASDQAVVQSLGYVSVDQLYKAISEASEGTVFKAIEPVKDACIKEIMAFCPIEVKAADIISRQFNEDAGISVTIVAETSRYVGYCLAKNADSLSSYCKDTMINSLTVYQDPWSMMPSTPTATIFNPPPAPWTKEPPGRPGETEKPCHEGRNHVRRHDDDDSDDRPNAAGVEIYVINNGRARDGQGGGRIDHGGHHRDDQEGSDGIHPVFWALVLPFFCVGLSVTVKHVVAFIKKRRGSLPVTVRAGDYEPLRTAESSS